MQVPVAEVITQVVAGVHQSHRRVVSATRTEAFQNSAPYGIGCDGKIVEAERYHRTLVSDCDTTGMNGR
jgi:hypothetical protein